MDMMAWIIVRDSMFARQYKNMGGQRQTRVDLAIKDLASSDNPENMGRYKKSMGARAYEIDKSDRLIYSVDRDRRQITLERVCDHKSVYGMD